MRRWIRGLARHNRGATAIEYGLILALITITMLVGFSQLAGTTTGLWGNLADKVTNPN
jgi:pilus assembly protein Flp/PilA